MCLVVGPYTGTDQFQEVPIRVSEINAVSSPLPTGLGLNLDFLIFEYLPPTLDLISGDCERKVSRANRVVWWNHSARYRHGMI